MLNNDALVSSFSEAASLTQRICEDPKVKETLLNSIDQLSSAFEKKSKVFFCGNGGSLCDAMHAAEELTGRFRKNRPALPAIAISDPAHLTCVGNDFGYEDVFSRFIEAHGLPGDWVVVLSTSGNSSNVIKAVQVAKANKLRTLAFLGKGGGTLMGQCDLEFVIPSDTSERIQEIHMMLLHILIEGIERTLFPHLY